MSEGPWDVIVVGSGAAGVHAALPLLEAGLSVAMLDVGHEDRRYRDLVPQTSFERLRRDDPGQHRYLLGDDFEGIPDSRVGAGAQLTPPRQHVLRDAATLAPTLTQDFAALQSFALGGLGGAWGAVSFPFLDSELERCGLPAAELRPHYEAVAQRVGVSGCADDDLAPWRGPLAALQPPLEADHNAALMMARYARRREHFARAGFAVGRPLMSILTQPLGERSANPCHDTDFWGNAGHSVWRPELMLEELRRHRRFSYHRPFIALGFDERPDGLVQVRASDLGRGGEAVFRARALVLAAGALGSTRIALRSLGAYDRPVPFVCNAHSYLSGLHPRALGRPHAERCHSMAQLTLLYDPTRRRDPLVQAQMYSYRSLMLLRVVDELPLSYREGLRLLRALLPSLVVWVVQHEDRPGPGKFCVLRRGASEREDRLEIGYREDAAEQAERLAAERAIAGALARLGCWPLRRSSPGHGSSIHYGGQLPLAREGGELTTEPGGRLRPTRAVYVADGASLAVLPAKGPTLTLMAMGRRVGATVAERLQPRAAPMSYSAGRAAQDP